MAEPFWSEAPSKNLGGNQQVERLGKWRVELDGVDVTAELGAKFNEERQDFYRPQLFEIRK